MRGHFVFGGDVYERTIFDNRSKFGPPKFSSSRALADESDIESLELVDAWRRFELGKASQWYEAENQPCASRENPPTDLIAKTFTTSSQR